MFIRPKRQQRAFPLALLSSTLVGVLLALVERIGKRGAETLLEPKNTCTAKNTCTEHINSYVDFVR